jgi:short-subunit dehydrogenase
MHPSKTMKNTVLVTGGTSGIGQAIARKFAGAEHDLVIVSRVQAHVDTVCKEIADEFGVETLGLALDLTEPGGPEQLCNELSERGVEVEILVNNAGRGERGHFHEIAWEDHLEVIRLNIEALTKLTHLFLPTFLERNHGRILNLGSVAGFQPGPLLAVYHASKAFVVSFSEAIAEETQDSKVTVTCICPGPTDTEFFDTANAEESRVAQTPKMHHTAEDVAGAAYSATMHGERVHVVGGMNKAMNFMRRLMPETMQAKMNKMLYETAG